MDRKMTPGRGYALALAGLLAVFIAFGLVILPIPFTRDQGIYAYNAWRWLGDAMPYRDAFDHKGPVLYLIYAVALKISGGAMWGPNLMDLIARAATVLFAFLAARRLAPVRAAFLAALFTALPLFGIFNACWWNAQAETFIMPLLPATVWLVARPRDRFTGAALALAGLLAGEAVMTKPTAGLHAVFLAGWVWFDQGDGRGRRLGYFGGGLAAGVGSWLGYYAVKGALGAMIEVLFVFNFFHAAAAGEGGLGFVQLWRDFYRIFHIIPVLAATMFFPRPGPGSKLPRLVYIGFIAAGLGQVMAQGKFFPYHWLVLVPALGMAAGLGIDLFLTNFPRRISRAWAYGAAALLIAVSLFNYTQYYRLILQSYRTVDYLAGRITLAEYYARFNTGDATGKGDFNLLASVAAADRARSDVPPGETLLVFGYEPIVNYLAARPAPTRFEIDYPLTFTPASAWSRAKQQEWRAEFLRDLAAHPPRLVILVDHDHNRLEPQTSLAQAREFAEFWKWLNENYEPDVVIEDFQFYERK